MIGEISIKDKTQIFTFDGQPFLHTSSVTNPETEVFLGWRVTDPEFFKLVKRWKENFTTFQTTLKIECYIKMLF